MPIDKPFTRWITSPLLWLLDWVEAKKGIRVFQKVHLPQNHHDGYSVVMSSGAVVKIYCHETRYCFTYSAWWANTRYISLYRVFSVCSDDTPQSVKNTFSQEFKIGNVLHFLSPTSDIKKAVIETYVDMLLMSQ